MFQLIVAVISIALVAALAIASIYYGGSAFSSSSLRANVVTLVNGGQQIAGAQALYKTDKGVGTAYIATLTPEYLSAKPGVSVIADATGTSAGWSLLSANVAYNSGYAAEPDNVIRQEAFTTLDAFVEWRPALPGPALRLWATNLTNARPFDTLSTFPTVSVLYRPGAPRRFGATATFDF